MLPFAIGAMVGAAAVRLLKTVSLRGSLDKAQERLRDATITSLDAIEHSSAGLKAKLVTPAPAKPAARKKAAASAPAKAAAETAAETAPEAAPAPKGRRRSSSPAAGTAKAAAAAKASEAAAPRARTRKKAAPPVPPTDTGDSA
ncbi:hypothetical protein LLG90_19330 [Aromatoleum toluclasticum]|uniref:hypothetical protein n=1 Tax=Aromatoleum toluclasticum TaxID=92003 RepID=UPI001D1921BC|nr:hypothetical protein [Aromatoleum toluclasticum]MCC4117513.1 hypothetical protein [Aromatoleum toluclasticum]